METITRIVGDLTPPDRSVFERVVGHPLLENQQIVVSVLNVELHNADVSESTSDEVPDYWKVYDGLDEKQIDALTTAVNQRSLSSRSFA